MHLSVGIAEMNVSDTPEDVLVTYSLGSCLGVTLYDPAVELGGMAHCMLPLARSSPERARQNACVFVDSGVSKLLQRLFDLGARRDRMVAKIAGAASQMDDNGFFRIGERNVAVLRKVLWKNSILIAGSDVGGSVTRTMLLEIGTGRTLVKKNGSMEEL